MKIKSYLIFNGQAEEALNFYAGVFNGTIDEMYRYGEYDDITVPDDYKNKIVHSNINFNGCSISAADAMPGVKTDFGSGGHTITLFCDSEQQIKDIHEKLSVGGQVKWEFGPTGFAKLYTEIADRFGVLWALIIE